MRTADTLFSGHEPAHLPPFPRRRFPCATAWFWHPKSGLVGAFHHSGKTVSQTLSIFPLPGFNDLRPPTSLSPHSVPYSGTGPRKRNGGRKIFLFLPPTATGHSLVAVENLYVSQFRRLNHQARQSHRRLLDCQTVAKLRNSHGRAHLGRLLTTPSGFFRPAGSVKRETTMHRAARRSASGGVLEQYVEHGGKRNEVMADLSRASTVNW